MPTAPRLFVHLLQVPVPRLEGVNGTQHAGRIRPFLEATSIKHTVTGALPQAAERRPTVMGPLSGPIPTTLISRWPFDNAFSVRATGGVGFATAVDGTGMATAGVILPAGSGTWSSISDREAKENVRPVDEKWVLRKLSNLPITSWNYRTQSDQIRHMGPTAQDFHAAFGLGKDDRHITTVDADGVALAAIQGLYRMLQDKQAEIEVLKAELADVKAAVIDLATARSRR